MIHPSTLVDFASDAAFAVAKDQRIVAWNNAARRVLGYAATEVLGRQCREVVLAELPGGEPICSPDCQGSLCFGRCQPFAVRACFARHQDGRRVPVALSTLVMPGRARQGQAKAQATIIFLHEIDANAVSPATPLLQPLRVFTFGRFALVRDGRHIALDSWERKQALTILKYLVMHRGKVVHRDRLIDCLWPDAEEDAGRKRLKVTMHFLRRQLGGQPSRRGLIGTVGEAYVLHDETSWVDATDFERLVSQGTAFGRKGSADAALRCYEDAATLYRGDYLEEDMYADWCAEERERLREIFFEMLARMADILIRQKRYVEAAQACRQALVREPCRESFHCTLIECWLALGQPDQAAAQYRRCREVLARELGVEPLPATQRLYQRSLEPYRSQPTPAC